MLTPFASAGVPGGTAQKSGSASRERMSGEARVSRTVRVLPLTLMPEMCFALPA